MQRRERRAVVVAVDVVEPPAAQPHVPVRDVVVDELDDRARRGGRVVRAERGVDSLLETRETADHPTVQRGTRLDRRIRLGRVPPEVRVLREDAAVHVLERAQESPRLLGEQLLVEAARHPHGARRHEKEPSGIGAVARHDFPRVDDVADALRHLLAFGVEHLVVHDDRAVRRRDVRERVRAARGPGVVRQRVAEPGRDRQQRVEPPARLIDALGDEIGRETVPRSCRGSRTDSATARTTSSPSRTRCRSPRTRGASSRRIRPRRIATCSDRRSACADRNRTSGARRIARSDPRTTRCTRRATLRGRRSRPAAAYPSSGRARSSSRCCSTATRRSAPRPPTADANRRARCAPSSRRDTPSCGRTMKCARSR